MLATKSQEDLASEKARLAKIDDDIPESAFLTERGLELAAQLKRLRYTESTLGSRHPSLPSIQEQIVSIRRILKSWGDEDVDLQDLVDDEREKEIVIVSETVLDQLSKNDLKQLVIRLAADVSRLRERLSELEEDTLPVDES